MRAETIAVHTVTPGRRTVLRYCALWEVDVYILRFIEIGLDAELSCTASDAGHCSLAGLLHHIAEIAGKLKLAASVNNGDFDIEHLAAHACPREAAHKADLIGHSAMLRLKLRRAEIRLQCARAQRKALAFAIRYQNIRFAA